MEKYNRLISMSFTSLEKNSRLLACTHNNTQRILMQNATIFFTMEAVKLSNERGDKEAVPDHV